MESSDEDDDSDVFYSCDSDYTLSTSNSNSSPLKAATINKSIMDDPPQEEENECSSSFDPISLNIMRKLSISNSQLNLSLSLPPSPSPSPSLSLSLSPLSARVRFSESSNITYRFEDVVEAEEVEEEESEEEDEGEKENKRVSVEIKKVFTRIITKAEEVQKNVASRIERKREKDIQLEHSRVSNQSPTRWLKELIGPNRPSTLQIPKNSVPSYARRKSKREFGSLVCVQTIDVHNGAIWTMKFSYDGLLMASGGQDGLLRLWRVNTDKLFTNQSEIGYFQKPHAYIFQGHSGDILDISWSKDNKQILSASMDRSARLWRLDQEECVHSFPHTDIVTSVTFHPTDNNLFLSGSLDNKLILWNIEQKSVVYIVDTHEFITTVAFTLNGKLAIAGLHSGMCTFYDVEELRPAGQLYVHSSRGRNKKGKKISGIEALPDGKHILITSNDSRIRLYKLENFTCEWKYKGLVNNSFQIKATCNANCNYVICGSEDNMVYIWNMHNDCSMFSPTDSIPIIGASSRRGIFDYINTSYECFATNSKHPTVVTVALFAPHSPAPPPAVNGNSHLNGEERVATTPNLTSPQLIPTSPPPPPPHDVSLSSSTSSINSTSSTTSIASIPPSSAKKMQAPSPPHKTLHHRNSISSIISMITPSKAFASHNKSATLPNPLPHHSPISHSLPHHSPSSQSQPSRPSTPPTTPHSKSGSPDGPAPLSLSPATTSSAPSDLHPVSSSPTSSQPKRGGVVAGGGGGTTRTGMELLVEEQQVYIITADAAGQIKVFENAPSPLSPSSSHPSSSHSTAASPSVSFSPRYSPPSIPASPPSASPHPRPLDT